MPTVTRHTKLSELRERFAHLPVRPESQDGIPARLVSSVQQSLAVEGYPMPQEEVRRVLVKASATPK